MQTKDFFGARSHNTADEARLVKMSIKKLIDAGGTRTDLLLLKLQLETSPSPADIQLMIAHPEVPPSCDREQELFLLRNLERDILAECGLPDEALVTHAKSGGSDTYRFADRLLRAPSERQEAEVRFSLMNVFAEGNVGIDRWDEEAKEPVFATGCVQTTQHGCWGWRDEG